jgi:hypothetical protein
MQKQKTITPGHAQTSTQGATQTTTQGSARVQTVLTQGSQAPSTSQVWMWSHAWIINTWLLSWMLDSDFLWKIEV